MSEFATLFELCRELYPNEKPIPLHAPRFRGNEKKYLAECIDTTYVSYVGEFVSKFEESVERYTGVKHAVSLCNGTVALHLALEVAGVAPGDDVLVPSLTFVAAANAVSHAGAKCVFVDSESVSLGMCPEKLESYLKSTKKLPRACVPVHVFGHPCRIEEITAICAKYGVAVIEDASESLGSFVGTKHTGNFGLAGVLSFNGNKTVTTGGGGMIITNDSKFAERARYLATTAKRKHAYEFVHDEVGYNYRMPNLNAAVGLAQMECLEVFLKDKRETASRYREFFARYDATFVDQPKGTTSNFWLCATVLSSAKTRESLLLAAVEADIQLRPVWKLMHHLPMYKDHPRTDMTVSEDMEARVVNLPSSVRMNR